MIRASSLLLALSLSLPVPALAGGTPGTIETYAGGHMVDGRPGLQNHIRRLGGVGVGPDGSIVFAETGFVNTGNLRVRAWSPSTDLVHTVAGAGVGASSDRSHDGAVATTVGLSAQSVAVDGAGNLFLVETGSSPRIRRVDAETRRLSTLHEAIALPPEAAIEVDAQDRVLFGTYSTIERWDPRTGQVTRVAGGGPTGTSLLDDRPATEVQIGQPMDIETDAAGNIYFAESTRIRWIDAGGVLHTIAGGRAALLTGDGEYGAVTQVGSGSHQVLARPDGSVWYTDGGRVRRIAPEQEVAQLPGSRRVTTVFQIDGGFADGPLVSASFGSIVDWEGYGDGGFVVADGVNLRVRLVSATGEVRTVVGNGLSTKFKDPGPDTYDWTGDGGPATTASVLAPCAVTVAPDGDVVFSEREAHHKIRRVDAETGTISTVAGGDVQGFAGDGGPATEADLESPCGVVVRDDGDVIFADTANHRVREVDAETGVITTIAGDGRDAYAGDGGPATAAAMRFPLMLALDSTGRLYVSDPGAHVVRAIEPDGTIRTIAGTGSEGYAGDGGPATAARLKSPRGLAVMPDGTLLIADSGNHVIRKVTPDGRIHHVAGSGAEGFSGDGGPWNAAAFDSPNGVAYDAATGTIFVADTLNQVVRRLDPDGMVRRVAATGELAFCGDGGPAKDACLRNPQGIALTPDGDLLIADYSNLRIRRVHGVV